MTATHAVTYRSTWRSRRPDQPEQQVAARPEAQTAARPSSNARFSSHQTGNQRPSRYPQSEEAIPISPALRPYRLRKARTTTLDRISGEPVPPRMARRPHADRAGAMAMDLAEGAPQPVLVSRHHDDMDVARHRATGPDRHSIALPLQISALSP